MAKKSFGCSVTSLLLLTGVCAVLLAILAIGLRTDEMAGDYGWTPATGILFIVLMVLCGMLVGHARFHRVRYVVWGGGLGVMFSVFLLAMIPISSDLLPELVITTIVGALGLIAFTVHMRRFRSP